MESNVYFFYFTFIKSAPDNKNNTIVTNFSVLMPNSLDDMKTLGIKNGKLRTLLIQSSEKITELVIKNYITLIIE